MADRTLAQLSDALVQSRMSSTDAAKILGFNDRSAFRRAVERQLPEDESYARFVEAAKSRTQGSLDGEMSEVLARAKERGGKDWMKTPIAPKDRAKPRPRILGVEEAEITKAVVQATFGNHSAPRPTSTAGDDDYPDMHPEGFTEEGDDLTLLPESGNTYHVMVIGDRHAHPGIKDLRNFSALGRWAAEHKPDIIIDIGDSWDVNSLCTHERNDTWKAKLKPSWAQDLAAFKKAWAAFEDELPRSYKPLKHITLGNHEGWIWNFEDKTPELKGTLTGAYTEVLESSGWSWSPYGQHALIGGVAFTHAPMSLMGKPLGGENVEGTVANKTTRDFVFGHTHRKGAVYRGKLGSRQHVTVLNAGSSMPPGYVGKYAQWTPHAVTYGFLELWIRNGKIVEHRHHDLARTYEEVGLGSAYERARA